MQNIKHTQIKQILSKYDKITQERYSKETKAEVQLHKNEFKKVKSDKRDW